MKKLLFILFALGSIASIKAQDDLERADLYFSRAYYSDAIPLYEELLPRNKSSKLLKNLADSYYHTFNMKAAARWYAYLVSNYGENIDENFYFKLNQSLKAIGEYEKAHQVLIDYYTDQDLSDRTEQVKAGRTYLENIKAIGERFDIENLALNTSTSEFGAAIVDSVLVYSASKKEAKALGKLYRWNNQNYLDFYSHPKEKLQVGDSLSTSFSKNINTNLHEGTFAITKDRSTIYFTRNSKKKTDDKISNLKLFKAEWIDKEWQNITELPFNGHNFSTEHPALSPDETKLYFASDRAGGYGGFDLYYVSIQKDGFFSSPVNLGAKINTDKKEQFPFIDGDGNLYFSSNGHPGFGLLDIFISRNDKGDFSKPDNLGLPMNSGYDDFSVSMEKNSKTGFFASNRPGRKGSDDIYSFTETRPLIIEDCLQYIAGTITDKTTRKPLIGASVEMVQLEGAAIEKLITGQDGSFKFRVDCNSSYQVTAQKEGYENGLKTVITDGVRKATKDASLELLSQKVIEEQKALALQKERKAAEEKAIALAQRKKEQELKAEKERIKKEKESIKKQALAQEQKKKKREKEIEQVIAKEEAIIKKENRTIVEIGEIHFDYSLWYVRREARQRLDKLVKIMKNNPGMVIEIGTHTDIRGNSAYNKELSQKRADAAKEYLVKNGINKSNVIAKGYGESQPIVKCETVDSCSEEDHEWNRRCELVVVKWE
ncbi:outer membrane protein OmpA-like peptidoglycan-associated protein [Flavobacteriaceae bacterium MAR_2009_75]|nr:outer membrane protein OmpA-like peptidoglycan-associated protein [Flavobacteriaceae bacterium MAR_2009_75]